MPIYFKAMLPGLVVFALMLSPLHAAPIDWKKITRLQGKEFLAYVESLNIYPAHSPC